MLKLVWSQMLPNDARGYGKVAQELGWALEEAGAVMLGRQDFGWDFKVIVSTPRAWYHADDKTIQPDLIYHAMYDSDLLPISWVKCFNLAGHIWVPSQWSKKVFERSGVTRPIFVSGYGVDEEKFFYTPPPPFEGGPNELSELSEQRWATPVKVKAPAEWLKTQLGEEAYEQLFVKAEQHKPKVRPFTFLAIATSLFDRKGALATLRAFRQLDLPNARLIVKFNAGFEVTVKDDPRITCLVGDYSQQEFADLIRGSHCVVYPSSGEGFGLIPLEAMALGRPVIVTNYSGMTEYIDERFCYPLAIEGIQKAELYNDIYDAEGSWAMISEENLVALMRHVYENYEEAIAKGRLASEEVLSQWTWKQAGKRAQRLMEALKYGSNGKHAGTHLLGCR